MAVRKRCGGKGCRASPRCDHPWWFDVMHRGKRYRMPVDDFACPRGATATITSKQEAEKVWESKFMAEVTSGKDPRVVPERESTDGKPGTVAQLLDLYRQRYVDVERLKSRAPVLSQLRVLTRELGHLPAKALERPDAIEDFKARCSEQALATTNRYMSRLRHLCGWAIGRELLAATPDHRRARHRLPARRDDENPEQTCGLGTPLDQNSEGELKDGSGSHHSVRSGQPP